LGILSSIEWWFPTEVSGHPIGPIAKGQALIPICLTVEDGTDKLSRNVGKKLPIYAA